MSAEPDCRGFIRFFFHLKATGQNRSAKICSYAPERSAKCLSQRDGRREDYGDHHTHYSDTAFKSRTAARPGRSDCPHFQQSGGR